MPAKNTPALKAEPTAGPVESAERPRNLVLAEAVEWAFETWRNRPGRANPDLVREALLDAATRAYDGREG